MTGLSESTYSHCRAALSELREHRDQVNAAIASLEHLLDGAPEVRPAEQPKPAAREPKDEPGHPLKHNTIGYVPMRDRVLRFLGPGEEKSLDHLLEEVNQNLEKGQTRFIRPQVYSGLDQLKKLKLVRQCGPNMTLWCRCDAAASGDALCPQ